jgi:hypothetical protein
MPFDPSSLHTLEKSNAGIKLPLNDPRTGEQAVDPVTGEKQFLFVLGDESSIYAERLAKFFRDNKTEDVAEADRLRYNLEKRAKFAAMKVIGATWKNPMSYDEALVLLKNAPKIVWAIEEITTDQQRFFAHSSVNSTPSPTQSST